jgi:hypothetical protein
MLRLYRHPLHFPDSESGNHRLKNRSDYRYTNQHPQLPDFTLGWNKMLKDNPDSYAKTEGYVWMLRKPSRQDRARDNSRTAFRNPNEGNGIAIYFAAL